MLASTNCSVTVVRLQTLIGALRENEAPNDSSRSWAHCEESFVALSAAD